MSNRVVITGVGAITPIGTGKDEFWKGLMEGRNGIDKISRFDASEFTAQIAGEVKDFDPTQYIDKKESKRMDRYTQFAVAAADLAIKDAFDDFAFRTGNNCFAWGGNGFAIAQN